MSSPNEKQHGAFYRFTKVSLGVISFASFILNFIPGANLVGAAAQAVVTLVETGMNLADGNKKKALLSFLTGGAMSLLFVLPEIGAAGAVAGEVALKGGAVTGEALLAAKTAKAAEKAVEGTSIWARAWRFITDPFKRAWKASKEIPVFRQTHEWIIKPVGGKIDAGEEFLSNKIYKAVGDNRFSLGSLAKGMAKHPKITKVAHGALFLGPLGLSLMNDSPPASALPEKDKLPNELRFEHARTPEGDDTRWQKYIDARRAQTARRQAEGQGA